MLKLEIAEYNDFIEYYGKLPPGITKGIIARLDGKVVGIAGITLIEDIWYGFLDIGEEIKGRKKLIVTGFKMFKEIIKDTNLPIVVKRDEGIETSGSLLNHFGFKAIGDGFYICQDLN